MSDKSTHHIWDPDTGITDLDADPQELSASQTPGIRAVWKDQQERLKGSEQLFEFTERLSREWAIETGAIENLYDIERGATQMLIEHGFRSDLIAHGSTNKPREYVIRLLHDQKNALEGVFDYVKSNRSLSTSYIKELHQALLRSQETTEGIDSMGRLVDFPLEKGKWKTRANFPVRDGVTYAYCPPEQVDSEMDRLVAMHASHACEDVPCDVQAAWLHHRFVQIHPFQDGNGRVARALATHVLVKHGLFPLVVTRDDKPAYLDSLERSDEFGLAPFISLVAKLQMTQFKKATSISGAMLVNGDVSASLEGLRETCRRIGAEKRRQVAGIFERAKAIETNLQDRLASVAADVEAALGRISGGATATVERSGQDTDHYFRAQIIENARNHVGYLAEMVEYRSWVALDMRWSRRGQLVFPIHGIGKPFSGALICAPFVEFEDADKDGQARTMQLPVGNEGFVFFYNEDRGRLLSRFGPWRENAMEIFLKELERNS